MWEGKSKRTFNPTNVTIKVTVMRTANCVVINLAVLKKTEIESCNKHSQRNGLGTDLY